MPQQIDDVPGLDANPAGLKRQGIAQLETMRIRARPKQFVFALPDIPGCEPQRENSRRNKHLEKRAAYDVGRKDGVIGVLVDQP